MSDKAESVKKIAAAVTVSDVMVLLILIFSSSVNAYFREVYEHNNDDNDDENDIRRDSYEQ